MYGQLSSKTPLGARNVFKKLHGAGVHKVNRLQWSHVYGKKKNNKKKKREPG